MTSPSFQMKNTKTHITEFYMAIFNNLFNLFKATYLSGGFNYLVNGLTTLTPTKII